MLDEGSVLEGLQMRFLQAMEARHAGDVDSAAELMRSILKIEPRLAEPRLELASILLGAAQLHEAEEQSREAIAILETHGQWVEDVSEEALLSLAYGTLGEALRRQADTDEVVFGDPQVWEAMIQEAKSAFTRAVALDGDNVHASYWLAGYWRSEE